MAAVNFSGLASGIDSSSLIKSLLDQERKVKIDPLDLQIAEFSKTREAFSKLSSLLDTLKTNASAFRAINGGAISRLVSSSDDGVVSASASNAAANGNYQITVTQLARNATFSFASSSGSYSSATDKISAGAAFSDNVTITIGEFLNPVDTVSVSVNENTTLSDFVNEFNSQTDDATASLINIGTAGTADYRIVISTAESGQEAGLLTVSVGAAITARNALNSNVEENAQNALFDIAGVASSIERQGNSVTDLIPGVTLNLQDLGTANLRVSADSTKSASLLRDVVDSLNEAITYIRENDIITQEEDGGELRSIFGSLARTSIDNNIESALRAAISSSSTSGGLVNTLAELGVTTRRDGTLDFDDEVFLESLARDPESAQQILSNLGESLSSTDGTISQFTRFNGIIDTSENSIALNIDNLNKRISEIESGLSAYEQMLLNRFSALEVLTGKLQSAQAALSGLPSA